MSAQEAAERFARGSGKTIPPPPFQHERRVPEEDALRRRPQYREEQEAPVYAEPRSYGCLPALAQVLFYVVLIVAVLGFVVYMLLTSGLLSPGQPTVQPQATTIPTRLPLPTYEPPTYQEEPAQQAPVTEQHQNDPPAEPQPIVAPAWSDTRGGPALQAEPEQDLTAATDNEAAINTWLAGEPSTPTPTRSVVEIVSDATFDASFVDPGCSPFVGYLPGDPCIEILKQQGGE